MPASFHLLRFSHLSCVTDETHSANVQYIFFYSLDNLNLITFEEKLVRLCTIRSICGSSWLVNEK